MSLIYRYLCSLLVFGLVSGSAVAQSNWEVDVLVPDAISLRVPTTEIGYDTLDDCTRECPARYAAGRAAEGRLPVQVFANLDETWIVLLEIPDLRADNGAVLIPANQIRYRVNQGLWTRGDGTPQVIYTQVGRTRGWLELNLEFELELLGTEPAARYTVNALVTAIGQE
ncbi:MAG: hypothetical protein U5L04_00425 [Trueperaceae bacterium]|nr:hypothetical protein [Trueperaceae bacterium]